MTENRVLRRLASGSLAVLVLIGAVVLLLIPMPRLDRAGNAALDLLHAPCFAILSWILYRTLARRDTRPDLRLAAGIWALLAGFAYVTELVQGMIGRNPSLQDCIADITGASAGLLWAMRREVQAPAARRALPWLAATFIMAGWVHPLLNLYDTYRSSREFPLLASFERPLELLRWKPNFSRLTRVKTHATQGDWALRCDLRPGRYSGAALAVPRGDWSQYNELVLDVAWEDEEAATSGKSAPQYEVNSKLLPLVVKVHDRQHNYEPEDRYRLHIELEPGQREIRIALPDIAAAPLGRTMNMQSISNLEIYTVDAQRDHQLYVDYVRLE